MGDENYYDEDDYPDDDDEDQFDCGAMRDMNNRMVGCQKAGSEECDFECPYRESVERSLRAQAAWAKRREKQGEK